MITLYNKSETNFEHNGIGSIEQDIIDPKIHWIDNGVFSFEFDYPLFAKHGLEITNSSIIKARDPEQDNLFFVYKIIPSMGYIKVYCYHIFYKLAFNTINDTNIVKKNGQGALTQLAGATQYPQKFRLTSDLTNIATSRVVRKNPVEILLDSNLDNSFINRWGGHIIRHGFNISMNQSYGSNKGYKIQHKKDLMGYEATIDETTVVTRIRPVGYDGLLLPEIYVDSPLINNYPEPRIQEYAYSDVKIGKGEGEFATAALAYAELRRLANLEFSQNKIDVPRGIYKIDFVNLKETEEYKNFAPLKQILPGDITAVEHEEDGINISSQMVEYNWDPLLKEYINLTLGNYERSFSATVNKIDKIQTDIKNIITQIELVYLSANGKNKIYTGVTEPVIDQNSTEGDLWFKKNGDKTEMWILRNVNGVLQWVVELSDATQEELKAEVGKAIEQADADRIKAEQEIKQALTDAKNYTEIKAQEFDSQLLIVNQNLATAKDLANAAVTKADKAIEDVGFIKPDVAAAKANATSAIQDASTATQNATTAIQNAQTALNSITTLSQEVDVSITNINGELTRKVSQTTFNTLSGTVGTHTTQIGQTQNALLAKAESSLVNTIKGTVDTHTTQIKVVSDGLELKADSSLVNTVKGTVDSHSSLISANSQAISARLTSTQIETLLTGKQYVNQTTLAATSNGLTAQITQVSTDLTNLEIGGRNLLAGTSDQWRSRTFGGWDSYFGYVTVQEGDWITGTMYLKPTNQQAKVMLEFAPTNSSSYISQAASTTIISPGSEGHSSVTAKVPAGATRVRISIRHQSGSTPSDTVQYKKEKVEFGTKRTDWSPAPEDMATLEKVVTIEANIDGVNTLVASKASQTQVTQLAGQVQTKVESATYNSKMTQLDSAINLRVVQKDITDAILIDKRVKDTRNDNQLPNWYLSNYPKQVVEELKMRTVIGVTGSAVYGQLTTNVTWSDTGTGGFIQTFRSDDGTFQRKSNASANTWGTWDKIAETGKLISQINISTEGILLQGKRIQLDGEVSMTSAFVARLDTQTLSAVYADIATLKARVLTANVIDSVMVNANTAMITKLFATDANVSVLTAKTAFINSVKAIDIAADRITAGTLNAANVNIINLNVSSLVGNISSFIQTNWNGLNTSISVNSSGLTSVSGALSTTLNAGSITTVSGTKTGTVNALGMQIADSSNGWTTRLYSDGLEFQWYGVIRGITQTSEGLEIKPTTGSGARLNSALALTTGPGNDKIAYLQLANPDGGTNSRLEMNGTQLSLRHPNGGSLDIADYAYNGQLGRINSGKFRTTTTDGRGIQMEVSQISVLAGNQTIYIMPSGTGELRIGNGSANPTLWPIRASQFIQGSSRDSKTNINDYTGNALNELNQLKVVTYNRKDDLARGVDYLSLGFIAEDSPAIAVYNAGMPAGVDQYKMVSLAIKGVQELNQKVISIANIANASNTLASRAFSEMQQLKNRVTELELKIKKMESAA